MTYEKRVHTKEEERSTLKMSLRTPNSKISLPNITPRLTKTRKFKLHNTINQCERVTTNTNAIINNQTKIRKAGQMIVKRSPRSEAAVEIR